MQCWMIIQKLVWCDDVVTEVMMHNKILLTSLTCKSSDPKKWSKSDECDSSVICRGNIRVSYINRLEIGA